MNPIPEFISIAFILTTLLAIFIFYRASQRSNLVLFTLTGWIGIQAFLGLSGFYQINDTLPPRLFLLPIPPLLLIIGLFFTKRGLAFIDGLNQSLLVFLHVVRIPVEFVLYGLFLHQAVPEMMTFEGRNFDILSGLSAPFVYYFAFKKNSLNQRFILLWNLICLVLLLNVVGHGVLSAPTIFQQLAFDQPNVAIQYFPFVWLPSCIVPLVLLAHLASLRKLLVKPVIE